MFICLILYWAPLNEVDQIKISDNLRWRKDLSQIEVQANHISPRLSKAHPNICVDLKVFLGIFPFVNDQDEDMFVLSLVSSTTLNNFQLMNSLSKFLSKYLRENIKTIGYYIEKGKNSNFISC